jgi:hypothetical protein
VLKCRACRKQFTVTVGTVFEDSHIKPHEMDSGDLSDRRVEEGHQRASTAPDARHHLPCRVVHGASGCVYAMDSGPMAAKLSGTVEVDEGYIGGKRKGGKGRRPADGGPQGCGRGPGRAQRQRAGDADGAH